MVGKYADMCRKKGIISFELESNFTRVKLLFGPMPAPAPKPAEPDQFAAKRAHYMNLLGRTGISDDELAQLPDSP